MYGIYVLPIAVWLLSSPGKDENCITLISDGRKPAVDPDLVIRINKVLQLKYVAR